MWDGCKDPNGDSLYRFEGARYRAHRAKGLETIRRVAECGSCQPRANETAHLPTKPELYELTGCFSPFKRLVSHNQARPPVNFSLPVNLSDRQSELRVLADGPSSAEIF